MNEEDLKLSGYIALILQIALTFATVGRLYYLTSGGWNLQQWIGVFLIVLVIPAPPGFMLMAPTTFLEGRLGFLCQFLSFFGMVIAGFLAYNVSPEWWIILFLAIILRLVAGQVYRKQRPLV